MRTPDTNGSDGSRNDQPDERLRALQAGLKGAGFESMTMIYKKIASAYAEGDIDNVRAVLDESYQDQGEADRRQLYTNTPAIDKGMNIVKRALSS